MQPAHHPEHYWRCVTGCAAKLEQFRDRTGEPLISAATPVTSLGSCFADHIRMFLKDRGYNYVVTEPNDSGSSANWGRVYNPVALRQIIDYCEDPGWRPAERWWRDGQGRIHDPYRAVAPHAGEDLAEDDFRRHRALARRVFESAEVVILTYGLVEVWESAVDGAVFQARPVAFDPARHRFRTLEYPECLRAIEAACAGVRRINPRAELILTVSPVPLRATFRPEVAPVTANAYSKAVLLAAVQTACTRLAGARYFPSYEIVTECVAEPFRPDGGVTGAAVETVMGLFERYFVRP
jgi:hypothetical protein